jgi:hypothetical protein
MEKLKRKLISLKKDSNAQRADSKDNDVSAKVIDVDAIGGESEGMEKKKSKRKSRSSSRSSSPSGSSSVEERKKKKKRKSSKKEKALVFSIQLITVMN